MVLEKGVKVQFGKKSSGAISPGKSFFKQQLKKGDWRNLSGRRNGKVVASRFSYKELNLSADCKLCRHVQGRKRAGATHSNCNVKIRRRILGISVVGRAHARRGKKRRRVVKKKVYYLPLAEGP